MAAQKPFPDDSYEAISARFAKIRQLMEHNINFPIPLLDPKVCPIEWSDDCVNQILVIYTNKRMEVLPIKVNGGKIRDYLQLRYFKIIYWCAMPIPCLNKDINPINQFRDIYYLPS